MSAESPPVVEQAEPVAPLRPGNGAAHDAPPEREPPLKRAVSSTYLVMTGVAGLVSVIVSLLFQLAPGLRPDPGDNVGADVSVVALEPQVSVRSWIERGFQDDTRQEMLHRYAGQLDYPGELLLVHVAVDGHKHRNVSLRYRIYDAGTALPVSSRLDFEHYANMRVRAPSQRSVQLMFVPDLTAEGKVFIRIELSDGSGLLSVATSDTIAGGRLRSSARG